MNDAVLQVLLILAFLAIGLISVTFPIYAISVNFLPQQKWESEKEREKRKNGLRAKITQLTKELGNQASETKQVAQIREELTKYETELQGTELRYQYLTVKGAVGIPVISLGLALAFASLGIYGFYTNTDPTFPAVISIVCSVFAIYRLYQTVLAVEYGALRPERTVEFNVGFDRNMEKKITIELGKKTARFLFVDSPESDVDSLYVMLKIPSELGVTGESSTPDILGTVYGDETVVRKTQEYLPKGRGTGVSVPMNPKKKGEYIVKFLVCAKGIYEYKGELTVEVV
jgi:hypothetical protein